MSYSIIKQISARRESPFRLWLNYLILVLAVPVVIIAFLSILVYSAGFFLWSLISGGMKTSVTDNYYEEIVLIERDNLKILMVEDETDEELQLANEAFAREVYGQDTYLFRVKTTPLIHGLHNSIGCFFKVENTEGLFLQQLTEPATGGIQTCDTRLVFLRYENFSLTPIEDVGPFYLYVDDNSGFIKGFNKKDNIEINLAGAVEQTGYLKE